MSTMFSLDMSNMSNDAETEISGIYGFEMLHMLEIKIDYRDGLVDFKCDSNRFHSPLLLWRAGGQHPRVTLGLVVQICTSKASQHIRLYPHSLILRYGPVHPENQETQIGCNLRDAGAKRHG